MQASTDSEVITALHGAAKELRVAGEVLGRHPTQEARNHAIEADTAACIVINWIEGMKRDRDNGKD